MRPFFLPLAAASILLTACHLTHKPESNPSPKTSEPQDTAEVSPDTPTSTPSDLVVEAPGPPPKGMVWIPGGTFQMGSDVGREDEAPIHTVHLDGFYMDETEVTNAQFAEFVKATGWETVAEMAPAAEDFPGVDPSLLVPGSLVLVNLAPDLSSPEQNQWQYVPGANWRHPEGPGSTIKGRENHPVIHVAYEDALAYAEWAGKQLPTEAQYEYAARGGHQGRTFVWDGNSMTPEGKYMANTWQGNFPVANQNKDGFATTAPVKSFPANDYGLFDIAGNVWEWCTDWYRPDAYKNNKGTRNPVGPSQEDSYDPDEPGTPKRVMRGGSFLCSANYCSGYRPAARMKSTPDTSLFHTGFRCVKPPN